MDNDIFMIDIPFAEHRLVLYTGEIGRSSFVSHMELMKPDWNDDLDTDGLSYENHIFIESPEKLSILLHELSHYFEWLFDVLSCTEESEFKACLMGDIGEQVVMWGLSYGNP